MPELPEVELVARSLAALVVGRRISAAELRRERLAPGSTPAEFARGVSNAVISSVSRRGKHILIQLNNNATLVTHLRMSGRFMLIGIDREDPKFAHAVFYFDDDLRLVFQDQRHFGMMKLVPTAELFQAKELASLAPEPFSDEFSARYFRTVLKSSKRSIKELLLDQTKVCGLGNIYVSEALFYAGVDPRKCAGDISSARSNALHGAVRSVLAESISHGSTMNVDPENIDGSYYGGAYEDQWRVYGREGQPCQKCDRPIIRIKQGGRSSFFCGKCQR